jgi:hypothetical protein
MRSLPALALAAALPAAGTAQAAEPPRVCVTGVEAESLVLVLAPDLLRAVGTQCASALPADALLRQGDGTFVAKYQRESDVAWTKGRVALAKLAGPDAAQFTESELLRPLVTSVMVPMLLKDLKPKSCPAIDRVLTQLAPLPPRNVARLAVTILQLSAADERAKGKKPAFPICPLDGDR